MGFRFGVFELDEQAGELRRGGQPVAIQPKPLALLHLLIAERARVVSADELMEALWPDTVVSPASLMRAVSHARRAIDDAGRGALIRSISRRGYRFTGDVIDVGGSTEQTSRASEAVPLPAVESPERRGFVGRHDALSRLDAALAGAASGRAALVLVNGPAGIGKTRLVELFAKEAAARGFLSVTARCRDRDGSPSYWAWAQVVRALAAEESLRGELAALSDTGALRVLAPALRDHSPELAARAEASAGPVDDQPADQRRFLFFDAATRALDAAARARPILLVLEDLQWAGSASLRLLEHLVTELPSVPVMIAATVRDEPRDRSHPVDRTIGILRQERCIEIALGGLSRGEVGEYLAQVIGRPAPADLTSELFARTEGIPFFVGEAVHLLEERGDLRHPERIPRRGVTLPPRAVDLIRRSLDGLSRPCAELLEAASVLGREFTLTLVSALSRASREQALDLMDEAIQSGVVEELEGSAASFRFTHALFEEAIYEGLSAGTRARLHKRAADRLEQQHAGAFDPVLSELAHHHHRSIAVGDPEQAYEFSVRAAEHALALTAYEQAAHHYEQAVSALEHCEQVDPSRHLETLLALGEAHRMAGDRDRRIAAFQQAMDRARALGRARDFARAATGYCDVTEWSAPNESARQCVEEALAGIEAGDHVGRARLTTRLAYLSVRERLDSEPLGREAIALARESGSPEALQEALYILHYVIAGPEGTDQAERAGMVEELLEATGRCRNRDACVIMLLDIACDCLIRGDRDCALRAREQAREIAAPSVSLGVLWHTRVWDTGLALLEGRLGEVEQRAHDALMAGQRLGHPFARVCFNGQMVTLDRERGDYEAVLARLGHVFGNQRLGATHWGKAIVARAELIMGNEDRARILFEEIAEPGFEAIARNIRWNGTIVEVAMLCAELEDGPRAKELIPLLTPVKDQHGLLPVPINYGGPVLRCMAALHSVLGLADDALGLYEDALAAARSLGARPTAARILLESAPLLARSGQGELARMQLGECGGEARAMGMQELARAAAGSSAGG